MKQLTALTLGLFIAGSPLAALAGSQQARANLAACNSSVEQALGAGTNTKLYGIKSRRDGDHLRLKAFPAEGDSQVLDCTVTDDGRVTLKTSDGVALGAPSFDGNEQLTQSN